MSLLEILQAGVPVVAFLLMMAVGLDVTRDDLRRVAVNPRGVAAATLWQTILLPLIALALALPFPDDSRMRDYILLTAACPGGGMSNVYVYLARANTALSVTLTAASCLLAVVTMPAIASIYSLVLPRPVGFALPVGTLLVQLLVMAVIPVMLGVWIRIRWPALEQRYGRTLRAASAAGVVIIVVIGVLQSRQSMDWPIAAAGLAGTGLVAAGMAAGWLVGAAGRATREDRFTLLTEFGVRNLAIAMVIEVTLLGNADFVAFGALTLSGQALLLLAAVRIFTSRPGSALLKSGANRRAG